MQAQGFGQDFVFRPKTGQRPDARQRQRPNQVHPESDFHPLPQATHVAHILWIKVPSAAMFFPVFLDMVMAVFHSLDHRTCREEEQSFEKGMRHQVEHPSREGAHPNGCHHKTQLADRRISQHFLNVKLPNGDGGCEQSCHAAHQRNKSLRFRDLHIQGSRTGDKVYTCRDHRGGVDQSRNRRGAGHGVWQPDKQRQLRRFPRHAQQHKQRYRQDHHWHRLSHLRSLGEDLFEIKAAESPKHGKGGDQETEIADAVGYKGFLGGDGIADSILPFLIPESNQQIRTQSDPFPADKCHQVVIAADQDHHGGNEQVHIDKEAAETAWIAVEAHVFVHVANGVDMDQRSHPGDYQHHDD